MEQGKVWGLNFLWAGWSAAVFTETLTTIIGLIGGITLIWLNIEGIINHRRKRK